MMSAVTFATNNVVNTITEFLKKFKPNLKMPGIFVQIAIYKFFNLY